MLEKYPIKFSEHLIKAFKNSHLTKVISNTYLHPMIDSINFNERFDFMHFGYSLLSKRFKEVKASLELTFIFTQERILKGLSFTAGFQIKKSAL